MPVFLLGGISACFLLYFLVKRRLLTSFVLNAVAGLLCCVLCVCLSPLVSIRFSLNLFTAAVSILLGPSGAFGMLFLGWIWG